MDAHPSEPDLDRAPDAAADGAVIRLPADLGIDSAAELRRELVMHVEDPSPVQIDAEAVSRAHAAALQLFCLFFRDRQRAGRTTHWRRPSAALRGAAELLGVHTLIQMPTEART